MDKWKKKAIELVGALAFSERKYPSVIPYAPQKTSVGKKEKKYFHRSSPERHGISSARICRMIDELEKEKRANLHSLLVIKDGEVIVECSHPGYDVNLPHQSHSMSKSLTGMAIGFLVEERLVDTSTRLVDIFPEYTTRDKRFKNMTVKHLLTMSSGVPFAEVGSVTESEWTKAFFESKLDFAPGTVFAYNSMNSYILSRIVTRLSGESLTDYLTERLFAPLGIRSGFWETSPEGVEKGGWGAYLSVESWAKIGVMLLNHGSFEGEEILPREWVDEMILPHSKTPESAGDFNYGYHMWVGRENDELLFNGMLGQNVWMCRKNGIVVSMTAENSEMFQKSPALLIVQKYLGGELDADGDTDGDEGHRALREREKNFFVRRHWIRPKKPVGGLGEILGLKSKHPFDEEWEPMLGTYTVTSNNQGILPLFVRLMQNNFTGGIESIRFERRGEELWFTSREGGVDYTFEVGIYDFKTTILDFNGEKYIANVMGEAMEDEERDPLYKLEIIFPELANTRRIKFSFGEEGQLVIRMTESPNQRLAEPLIEAMYITSPKLSFALGMVEKRLGDKIVKRKLEKTFSPTLVGVNTQDNHYEEIMNAENEKVKEDLFIPPEESNETLPTGEDI